MGFYQGVNSWRRVVMRGLTRVIGANSNQYDASQKEKLGNVKRVLLCRPNSRLGNQLMITPLVQELLSIYPDCKIDLFVRGGLSNVLFENYEQVDRIIQLPRKPFDNLIKYLAVWVRLRKHRYDLAISVDGYSSSGRLSTRFCRAKVRFFSQVDDELQAQYPDYVHMAKQPVYNLRKLLSLPIETPIPILNIRLSDDEMSKSKALLDSLVDPSKKTISIYTFATAGKCFSTNWWEKTYNAILERYGEKYNLLEVLPVENVSQIGFRATSYYSKDIREMAALMASTEMYVGADCGIMHLASAAPTPVVSLFSVTNIIQYQPYNKGSIALDMKTASVDDLLNAIDRVLLENESRVQGKQYFD